MAGPLMRSGRRRPRRRRRRPHRRQRRHRQQDRHLHGRGAGARAQDPVLRRRAALDDRPRARRTARRSRSRSANEREVTHIGVVAADARGRAHPQPGLRRDAAPLHHRHHHREGASSSRPTRSRSSAPIEAHRPEPARHRDLVRRDRRGASLAETGDPARPWAIRSSIVASQTAIHREWGGVVPELASRQHVRDICGVVEAALGTAGASLAEVGAVAVTQGPGLVGSLLVGVAFAKAFAWARGIPVDPVHHLAGHIESLVLAHGELPLPAAVLVVSGGHTSLFLITEPGSYRLIGRTRDDAAGEAYDKVAKLLGLGYPGGPVIDRLAREGNDAPVDFPTARLTHADRNAPPPRRRRAAGGRRAPDGFQLQRAEDRGAAPGARAHRVDPRGRAGTLTAPGRCCRRRNRRHLRQLPAGRRRGAARSDVRGGAAGSAPAASASPAGSRPIVDCAPTPKPAAFAPAFRCSSRRLRSRPTMPR